MPATTSSDAPIEKARPARPPGIAWWTIILAALLMLATLPGRTQGLGLITEPLLRDLRLDRVTYASLNLWATLLGAAFCFPAGWILDRFGLRFASAALVLLLGLTVWRLSSFTGGVAGLFALLLLTRALGQSALSVASITAAARACGRRLGPAMGAYSFLLSLFFIIAFGLVGSAVTHDGWRMAWRQVAVVLVLAIAPLTVLFLRNRPISSVGRAEAGDAPEYGNSPVSFTLPQAMGSLAFWVFGLGAALFNLVSSGLGLFNEAVLLERGFDETAYHHFLEITTLAALIGQLLCGWLGARLPFQRLMGVSLFLYAAALGMLPFVRTSLHLWIFATLIGVAGGMITVVFFAIWGQAFGSAHLGRIQGAAQLLTVASSAVGPLLFAQCAAVTGSYSFVLFVLAGVVLALAFASWNVRVPQPAISPDKTISTPLAGDLQAS